MLDLNTARVLHPASQVPGLKAVMPATPSDVYDSMRRQSVMIIGVTLSKLISTVGDLENPKATDILRPIELIRSF